MKRLSLLTLSALPVLGVAAPAQTRDLARQSLEGPRLGIVTVGGRRALAELRAHDLHPVLSLFGWHFEQRITPEAGGATLVTEQILAVLGVEQSTVIPTATVLLGVRLRRGFEIGVGPNISPLGGAVAVGVGWTFDYQGVALPLNLAYVHAPGAFRVALAGGYAIRR